MQPTTAQYQSQLHFQKNVERFVHQQSTNHVQKPEFLISLQFGLGKSVFSVDVLLFFIKSFCKKIDSNNIVRVSFLYRSKAFDPISHDILIEKLKIIGFDSEVFSNCT